MIKILEIKFCQQCSYFLETNKNWCGKITKEIDVDAEQGFPDWCPLEDAPSQALDSDTKKG
jgi:hypothetical protein